MVKVPSKGTTVTVEGYGSGLFVKGPDMDSDEPEVWVKFECQEQEDGSYADEIEPIPWEEFKEKRVHPEQQPTPDDIGHDWSFMDEIDPLGDE